MESDLPGLCDSQKQAQDDELRKRVDQTHAGHHESPREGDRGKPGRRTQFLRDNHSLTLPLNPMAKYVP